MKCPSRWSPLYCLICRGYSIILAGHVSPMTSEMYVISTKYKPQSNEANFEISGSLRTAELNRFLDNFENSNYQSDLDEDFPIYWNFSELSRSLCFQYPGEWGYISSHKNGFFKTAHKLTEKGRATARSKNTYGLNLIEKGRALCKRPSTFYETMWQNITDGSSFKSEPDFKKIFGENKNVASSS